jgi:hypothetical protein
MEASSARSTQKFSALTPDLSFEFREKFLIVLAHSVHQTGNQQIMTRLRNGQEPIDEFAGAGAFPFSARKASGINERARFAAAIEETFLEQTIESGHDRRVGKRTRQFIDDIADIAVAVRPKNFHNAFFEMAERRKRGHGAFCSGPRFPETEHLVFRAPAEGAARKQIRRAT